MKNTFKNFNKSFIGATIFTIWIGFSIVLTFIFDNHQIFLWTFIFPFSLIIIFILAFLIFEIFFD